MLRDCLIESWAQRRSSPEVYAEILLADVMGHTPGDPSPLGWLPPWPDAKPPPKPKYRSGLLPQHLIDQAKSLDILGVATRLGLGDPVKRSAQEFVAMCALHDDTSPSLCLNSANGVWFCHPCQEGGDILKLVQLVLNLGFRDAVSWLLATPPPHPKRKKRAG